jgi:hypothetical protein
VCRCGSERRRLEAAGYQFDTAAPAPETARAPLRTPSPEYFGPVGTLIGYRFDTNVSAGWRALLKGLTVAAAIAVGAATVHYIHTDLPSTRENIMVLTTLETYTRRSGPDIGNTIPAFLTSAGVTGVLAPSGTSEDPVRAIDETQLREGFCSPSIAVLVRHEYPGYYDNWPDEKLERVVLEKHSDYTNRFCMLSSQLDASPDEIIKYEVKPRTLLSKAGLWLGTLVITTLFAVACLNLYYRVLVGRLASTPRAA